jgi:hypothetical protein
MSKIDEAYDDDHTKKRKWQREVFQLANKQGWEPVEGTLYDVERNYDSAVAFLAKDWIVPSVKRQKVVACSISEVSMCREDQVACGVCNPPAGAFVRNTTDRLLCNRCRPMISHFCSDRCAFYGVVFGHYTEFGTWCQSSNGQIDTSLTCRVPFLGETNGAPNFDTISSDEILLLLEPRTTEVLRMIQEPAAVAELCDEDDNSAGWHAPDDAARRVLAVLLGCNGWVYSTIDEFHFKAIMNRAEELHEGVARCEANIDCLEEVLLFHQMYYESIIWILMNEHCQRQLPRDLCCIIRDFITVHPLSLFRSLEPPLSRFLV